MANALVLYKNVKCRFSDYLLLESVWTGAVFQQPSVSADGSDLWPSPLQAPGGGRCGARGTGQHRHRGSLLPGQTGRALRGSANGRFPPRGQQGKVVSCLLLGEWCSSRRRRRRPSLRFSERNSPAAEPAPDSRRNLFPLLRTEDHFKPSSQLSEEIQTRAKKGPRGHRYTATVLLTYLSWYIKKLSFIEDKYRIEYLLKRDISNFAGFHFFPLFFFFLLFFSVLIF